MSSYRDEILAATHGQTGEVRINCPNPECHGGQTKTLGVNAEKGLYSCFRCGIKGNLKKSAQKETRHEYYWNKAKPAEDHPYLDDKGIKAHGIGQDRYGNLLIPYRQHGQLTTCQRIEPKPDEKGKWPKNFLSKKTFPDAYAKGSSFEIDGDSSTVYVAEGYSTGASIHEATGATVIVVGFKDNFGPAMASLRHQYPNSQIVFCADNDSHGKGLEAARKAALPLNARVTMPEKTGWDFNDLYVKNGADAVRTALSKFVEPENIDQNDGIRERAQAILQDREAAGEIDMSRIPKVIANYVAAICATTQANTMMVLMSVLGCISALIVRRAYIPEGKYFQRLFPNLWMLCLALSGAFKTTALNKGMRMASQKASDIREKIAILLKRSDEINDDYSNELKKEQKDIKKRMGRLAAENPFLPNRVSGEGLLDALATGQGGVIAASEFGDWQDNLGKSHNQGLKPLFTDLYDVPESYENRTRTGGRIRVQRPFISIVGFSTPDWVQENLKLSDVGSGFFARFLLFNPPQTRAVPPALPEIQAPFDCKEENIIKANIKALGEDRSFGLEPKAAEYFAQVHQGLYEAMTQLSEREQDLLAPYLKRWSPYILKLAIIFQVAIDPKADIGVEAVKAGATIVEYAMKSTVHLFKSELGLSPVQRSCQAVLHYIAKRKGTVRRHQLMASRVLPGGSKEYDEIIGTLELQNQIEILPSKTGKKKDETIRLIAQKNEKFD